MDLPEEERRVAVRARPCEVAGYFDASGRLCSKDQSQRVKRDEVLEDFEAVMCLDVLRLGFATAALRGKAVEDHRSQKRWRVHENTRNPRSVLECASPLAPWA